MRGMEVVTTVVRYLISPFVLLFRLITYLLHWLVSPFLYVLHLGRELVAAILQILGRFEPIWYFLGSGVLIGAITALVIYGILRTFVVVFGLDRQSTPKPVTPTGHDAVSYRAARAARKQKEQDKEERRAIRAKLIASQPLIQEVVREARQRPINLSSPLSPNTGTPATRAGLFQDIILEHTDEDEDVGF